MVHDHCDGTFVFLWGINIDEGDQVIENRVERIVIKDDEDEE